MTLFQLNQLPVGELKSVLHQCCGSSKWVNKMLAVFPVENLIDLFEDADDKWEECTAADWKEAFTHHPKIGDIASLREKFADTAKLAAGEQIGVTTASEELLQELADGNRAYEQKFGYIFIVCATGKSAGEMLALLKDRLFNTAEEELLLAAAEQAKITRIRLQKLLSD